MVNQGREPVERRRGSQLASSGASPRRVGRPVPARATETDGRPPFQLEVPSIALPSGGGAIKGIDEQFAVNAATGTMSLSFALPITPGRGGHAPSLRLAYDSGSGNGVAGLGWSIEPPSIGRRTDRGVPQYRDDDVFTLAGSDDLVLAARWDGQRWLDERTTDGPLTVERFRPRLERQYDRIERITDRSVAGRVQQWWRAISGDDVTTCYGLDATARLADPADASRVLRWLPSLSFDDLGNCCVYDYRRDDQLATDAPPRRSDANRRRGVARFTNTHLVGVRYGNRVPYFVDEAQPYHLAPPAGAFHFHLVLDHGDHDHDDPRPDPVPGREWPGRADPFSSYRGGFEVRTQRLVRRVLMFHEFDELDGGRPTLVRSLDLSYAGNAVDQPIDGDQPIDVALLTSVTQRGYTRRPDGTLSVRALPPVQLDYQPLVWSTEVRTVHADDAAHLPAIGAGTQWLDLDGDGLVGAFTESEGAWHYRASLGPSGPDGGLRLDRPRPVDPKPSFTGMSTGTLSLVDLDADGCKQIVVRTPEIDGFFERVGEGWAPLRPTERALRVPLDDRHVRMLDLVGDGRTDVLIAGDDELVWYRSLGRRGHDTARRAPRALDEEHGPAAVFVDDVQSVFLADMSGDGLIDIVRIRNGDVSYWPNLGHGRFGARVAMDGAPFFDSSDQFHPERLRLADITGTGTTDIVHLGRGGCIAYRNLAGNGWSGPQRLAGPPAHHGIDVSVTDVLGNGTPCLVWCSPLPADRDRPLRYVDLMGGTKPHLLCAQRNNLGAERTLTYRTSTWFLLRDRAEGRPWATRLAFPVHCVHTSAVHDRVAGTMLTSTFRYHHGTYDAAEREFRGFACVEQLDAEDAESWARDVDGRLVDAALRQAPSLTITWFHTGVGGTVRSTVGDAAGNAVSDAAGNAVSDTAGGGLIARLRAEQWDAVRRRLGMPVDVDELQLAPPGVEPAPGLGAAAFPDWDAELARQATRACRGTELRRELFGLDAPDHGATGAQLARQRTPYSVVAKASTLRVHQPVIAGRPAVVSCHERESLTTTYERDPADPRVAHALNVVVDEIGTVLESATIAEARRVPDPALPQAVRDAQARRTVTYTHQEVTADATSSAHHRLRQPRRTTVWEIVGLARAGALFAALDFRRPGFSVLEQSREIGHHEWEAPAPAAGVVQRRMLRCTETDHYATDLVSTGDPAQLDHRAIVQQRFELAWTADLLTAVFGDRVTPAVLDAGRFVERAGQWWVPSGRWVLVGDGETAADAAARFHAHIAHVDAHGSRADLHHLGDTWLLIDAVTDAAQNRTRVEAFDLRVMQPRRVVDANGNVAEALFDELGWLVATAVLGKAGGVDDLTGIDPFNTPETAAAAGALLAATTAAEVHGNAATLLRRATVRHVVDTERYRTSGGTLPPVLATIVRERHADVADSLVQVSFEYSNGAGAVEMRKVQAEPGTARRVQVAAGGTVTIDEVDTAAAVPPQLRWLGDGRQVRNNKGNVVKAYEPFFSVTPQFESARELVESGVTKVQWFDPVDRPVRVDHPDGTFADVTIGAWSIVDRDRNDNVSRSAWYDRRINRRIDAALVAAGRDPVREEARPRPTPTRPACATSIRPAIPSPT